MTAEIDYGSFCHSCSTNDVIKSQVKYPRQLLKWRRAVLKELKVAIGPRN